MPETRKLVSMSGRVTSAVLQEGTASEHRGFVLDTEGGEHLILVRHGGNPFQDDETRSLLGREVEVKGYRIGVELRYTEAKPKGK